MFEFENSRYAKIRQNVGIEGTLLIENNSSSYVEQHESSRYT